MDKGILGIKNCEIPFTFDKLYLCCHNSFPICDLPF